MGYAAVDVLVARQARQQAGLVSRDQLIAHGLSARAISYRINLARLRPVLPTVYALPGSVTSYEADLWAGLLWCGENSAVSHASAARKWGFEGFGEGSIEISTLGRRRCVGVRLPSNREVVVHRVDEHLTAEIGYKDGLAVTSPRRTLLDLCGRKDGRVGRLTDQGLKEHRFEISGLWLYLEQEWMRGRRGVAILRTLLAERTPETAPTDSELERELVRLIHRAGLPRPHQQFKVRLHHTSVHLDLAYPERKLGIEVDSYSWHMDRQSFERDRERDNELARLGWTILRFTWTKIRYEKARVIELISGHLTPECAIEHV